MTAPSGYTSISGEYPRFAYIKIYRKGTTKQAMLETLKECSCTVRKQATENKR